MPTYDSSFDNDIPELNKCPKCGAFFDGLICPICGEFCPEEMRAGNRKKTKSDYRKPVKGVKLTPFYLKWWFILIVSFFSRIIAFILAMMTDWKAWVKVLVAIALVLPFILEIVIGWISISGIGLNKKADYSMSGLTEGLSETEYKGKCQLPDYEKYCGDAENEYVGDYLVLCGRIKSNHGENFYGYQTYVITNNGNDEYVVCDYSGGSKNPVRGREYTVYGRYVGQTFLSDDIGYLPTVYIGYFDEVLEENGGVTADAS